MRLLAALRALLALICAFAFLLTAPVPATAKGGANSGCGNYCPTDDTGHQGNGNAPQNGTVGNADDKNPPGQAPDGGDDNHGYECDRQTGVGDGNPAHTGCTPNPSPSPTTSVSPSPSPSVTTSPTPTATPTATVTPAPSESPQPSPSETSSPTPQPSASETPVIPPSSTPTPVVAAGPPVAGPTPVPAPQPAPPFTTGGGLPVTGDHTGATLLVGLGTLILGLLLMAAGRAVHP